jgi:hypothetical protein
VAAVIVYPLLMQAREVVPVNLLPLLQVHKHDTEKYSINGIRRRRRLLSIMFMEARVLAMKVQLAREVHFPTGAPENITTSVTVASPHPPPLPPSLPLPTPSAGPQQTPPCQTGENQQQQKGKKKIKGKKGKGKKGKNSNHNRTPKKRNKNGTRSAFA